MRVYFINSVYKYGSTGNICDEIKKRAEEKGAACRVAYGRKQARNIKGDGYLIANKIELLMHVLFTRLTDQHGLFSNKATKELIKDILQFEPDIIHLHNLHGYFLNYEILFKFLKTYHKPIVWTLHDCWAFTGHCAFFDAICCEKWKNQCEGCKLKHQYPQSWLTDNSKQNYRKKVKSFTGIQEMCLVTPSFWLAGKVKESFLKEYPVEVIYNGLDLDKFYPRDNIKFRKKIDAIGKKLILGVASVWASQKGLERFIELQNYLDDSYLIVLVGVSEKQRKLLPKQIYGIDRTESVEELAEIYSAADVYFNSSIEETMGLTTVEALACGTPVIVYNRTAIPEVVPEGGGIILEPGEIKEVKEAIDLLINNPRKHYSEMVGQFEKKEQYEKYLSLYDNMLGREKCEG